MVRLFVVVFEAMRYTAKIGKEILMKMQKLKTKPQGAAPWYEPVKKLKVPKFPGLFLVQALSIINLVLSAAIVYNSARNHEDIGIFIGLVVAVVTVSGYKFYVQRVKRAGIKF